MKNRLLQLTLAILFIIGISILLLDQRQYSSLERRELARNESFDFTAPSIETILNDQFPFRDNLLTNVYKLRYKMIQPFMRKSNDSFYVNYINEDVVEIDDGYLLLPIPVFDELRDSSASSKGYNINAFDLKYPDIKTYIYLPTRYEEIADIGWVPDFYNNGEEYLKNFLIQLNDNITFKRMEISTVEDYKRLFFKTDHHWNIEGAYYGYTDIINMIKNDFDIDEPRNIKEKVCMGYEFKGYFSAKYGQILSGEEICDYQLEGIPDYEIIVDPDTNKKISIVSENPLKESKEDYIKNGQHGPRSDYELYFGENYFECVFDFNQPDKPNLLIFRDSYNNITREWIASHFNKTVEIDLRSLPEDADIDEIIKKYDIDAVLILQMYNDLLFHGNFFIPIE